MYATALIVFREVLEAGLVIGIVLAATQDVPQRGRWVLGGAMAGLLGAVITAGLADQLMAAMAGVGQEIFNASILILAVAMLGWHTIWMQKHGRELAGRLRGYGTAVVEGESHISALAIVVALAVLREGAEVVLFLHGIAASDAGNIHAMLLGGAVGIGGGALAGLLIYRGLLRIPSRHLFRVTTWLIILLAAGMAAQAAHYLEMANVLPSLGGAIWNTTAILPDSSIGGQVLHTLIGYTARPDVLQLLAYIGTLALIIALMKYVNRPRAAMIKGGTSAIAVMTVALFLGAGSVNEAHASHKVYSPQVEKGELEVEFRGHVDNDDRPSLDNARKDIYEIGYGITDRWFSSLFVEYEKEPSEEYEHTASAWENIFQLTETGRYWLDAGLYLEYEWPTDNNMPDKLEFKLLLEKALNRWVHTANLSAEREVGSGAEHEIEFGYAWRTLYRFKPAISPGVELYGDLGSDKEFGLHRGQTHQAGPALLGEFKLGRRSKLAYEAGYLIGTSNASPDNTFKWVLEFETRF